MLGLFAFVQPTLKIRSLDVGIPVPMRGRPESIIASLEAQPTGPFAWFRRICGFGRVVTVNLTSQRVTRVMRGRQEEVSTSVPLSSLSAIQHDYSKPYTKLFAGILLAIFGLAGVFLVGPKAVMGLLVGGGIIAWHFLSGPKFSLAFSGHNGVTITLKVYAGANTQTLVQFAEASVEQLRLSALPITAAPPATPTGAFAAPRA